MLDNRRNKEQSNVEDYGNHWLKRMVTLVGKKADTEDTDIINVIITMYWMTPYGIIST